MIEEWSLEQFKSIGQRQTLEMRPLTVLAGANSSGKSTILQSMLVLRQTLASKVEKRQLLLNGELVRLGSIDDIVSQGADEKAITFGCKLRIHPNQLNSRRVHSYASAVAPWILYGGKSAEKLQAQFCFVPPSIENDVRSTQQLELQSAMFHVTAPADGTEQPDPETFCIWARSREQAQAELTASHASADYPETIASGLKYGIAFDQAVTARSFPYRMTPIDTGQDFELVGALLEHFLPNAVVAKHRTLDTVLFEFLSRVANEEPQELSHTFASWLGGDDKVREAVVKLVRPEDIERIQSLKRPRRAGLNDEFVRVHTSVRQRIARDLAEQTSLDIVPPPAVISTVSAMLVVELAFLRYLGPLREEPRPVHQFGSGTDPKDVGTRGEFTASVLDLFGNTRVEFVDPDNISGPVAHRPLKEAVHRWLRHFELADRLDTHDAGKLGHILNILPPGLKTPLDLTNVGVGVSQVLPILVMALISEPHSVLLFEQPELHLHPKVQAQLADFFIGVSRSGRQCIVETHSEYLVNRLRRRVAESAWEAELGTSILLYFVERIKDQSLFKAIDINPYGAIPEWPKGFFDQGPNESELILAAAHAKRARKAAGRER